MLQIIVRIAIDADRTTPTYGEILLARSKQIVSMQAKSKQ